MILIKFCTRQGTSMMPEMNGTREDTREVDTPGMIAQGGVITG